jgi:small-conductance mechanosensitive channel
MEGAMDIWPRIHTLFADGRLGANLIAAHGLITVTILVSLILRRLIRVGENQLALENGPLWLGAIGEEAARRIRKFLFWTTFLAVLGILGVSVTYHVGGADIREHLQSLYQQFTVGELVTLCLRAGSVVGVLIGVSITTRIVRRVIPLLEASATRLLERTQKGEILRAWFALLDWYQKSALRLVGLGLCGVIINVEAVTRTCEFLLALLTIAVAARLLSQAFRIVTVYLAEAGNRYVGAGPMLRYWERMLRLIPFGERCFDAAIYIWGASEFVKVMHFLPQVAQRGPAVVDCIGIFFLTRVLIELFQVLLGEAFGLYGDPDQVDQKAQTLVPLLASLIQYVLYFGSALLMMQKLKIDTTPFLAGASIIGLAVGLGAQSLVTDVVSGFFILFENQYMVGDFVQIGDAVGSVEEVGIRVTKIRDAFGKLFIIPNGQVKGVVSYSKGFVNAVVDMKVSTGSDLEGLFRAMAEAGKRLRQARREVLEETHIHGLLDLGTSDMTVRAVTKVKPGTHWAMQNEYRKLLKQVFDEKPLASAKPALAA